MSADNTRRLANNQPRLFTPTVVRHVREGSSGDVFYEKTDSSEYIDTALGSSGSHKYNQIGKGLSSTQQINIDWSDFANHTFFNSAQVKTNVAFNKIINEFPFNGTKGEVEIFLDKLTGFEKWVYNSFPKNKGFLFFSGSATNNASDVGTFVTVKDVAGAVYPTLSKKVDAQSILDPGNKSMTVEMYVYVPGVSGSHRRECVLSKASSSNVYNNGFAVYNEFNYSSDPNNSTMTFMVHSSSYYNSVDISIPINTWTHVCWTWNKNEHVNNIFGYKDGVLYTSGANPFEYGDLSTYGYDFYIGSGSNLGQIGSERYTAPNCTFSGSIDELRIWHNVRTEAQIKEYKQKSVYASDTLKLYFKFNEPSGSNSAVVLDHSSNSIHGKLNDRALVLGTRDLSSSSFSGQSPMIYEKLDFCPILFPTYPDNVSLKTELLLSASVYDSQNPSIITNLVPKHFLLEGKEKDGFDSEEGEIINAQNDSSDPRGSKLGGTQVLLSLLYTWAKFFDEMKLYIQAFSTLDKIDYNNNDTVPDEFLNLLANSEGVDLPPLFVGTSIEQYINGENLTSNISTGENSLRYIQNQIWRRILINMPDIVKSKGTIHSIKSFIRAAGIDPDNNFRIREYGGPVKGSLVHVRENRTEISTMIDFVSGGYVVSPILSSSRNEPGWPYYTNTDLASGYLTSGSFTYEAIYKFNKYTEPQSLFRLHCSGTGQANSGSLLLNLVVGSASNGNTITLYAHPNATLNSADYFELAVTGVNLFDGNKWNISCGKIRNDDPQLVSATTPVSGMMFLKLAKQNNGAIEEFYSTSSYYKSNTNNNAFKDYIAANNIGVYFCVGSASLINPLITASFLENTNLSSSARTTAFNQKVSQIRFWTKALTDKEFKEHTRNYRSVGSEDPKSHWNFVNTNVSNSYNRLRIDASTDQVISNTDSSGSIYLTDFTQNNLILTGTNFHATSSVIVPERFEFSYISSKIDEGISTNKVRVRSFLDEDKLEENPWAQIVPVYDTDHSLSPNDSAKLSIDFSIIDALDQDIMTIFASLDEMNNYIGNPELMFADGYKDLEVLREIYFNKLQDKVNLKGFFEFYKWFDTNIGIFISQLVPRKTKFLGTNYILESHVLERCKVQYKFEDHWLGEDIRSGLKIPILLQILNGSFNRF